MSQTPTNGQAFIAFLVRFAAGTDLLETFLETHGFGDLAEDEFDETMEQVETEARAITAGWLLG